MATQKEILTRELSASVKKTTFAAPTTEVDATVTSGVGTLAIGKPGDIVERAYGPVVRTYVLTAETAFGAYVTGKGILVNPNDVAGIASTTDANPFDTKSLKAGQVGSFLVSGACVVKGNQVQAIANAMKVQYIDSDFTTAAKTADDKVFVIEVNGFDSDIRSSSVN